MIKLDETVRALINQINEETQEYTYADAERDDRIKIDAEGNIDCSRLGLTSLEGAPQKIRSNFICDGNLKKRSNKIRIFI